MRAGLSRSFEQASHRLPVRVRDRKMAVSGLPCERKGASRGYENHLESVAKRVPDARCELCEREVPRTTVHHLTPRSTARRKGMAVAALPRAALCPPCHKQLHALFPNQELAQRLDSIPALREDERVARFLAWVRKQPGAKGVRVRR